MNELANKRMKLHRLIVAEMRRAGWQSLYPPAVEHVKRGYLTKEWDVASSTKLTPEQLDLALQDWAVIRLVKPDNIHYALPTQAELKKLIALGRYRMAEAYGKDFLSRHLPDWTEAAYEGYVGEGVVARREKNIYALTRFEARYAIRRMEQIEFRYAKDGRHGTV